MTIIKERLEEIILSRHTMVLLALSAIGLVFYAVIDGGNHFGQDEWQYIYSVLETRSASGLSGRVLNRVFHHIAFRGFGLRPVDILAYYIVVKVLIAFLIYLIIDYTTPKSGIFALACGAVFLTYIINNWSYILVTQNINKTSVQVTALTSLYLYLRYSRSERRWQLILSIALGALSTAAYEGIILWLVFGAGLIVLWQRTFSRRVILIAGLWVLIVSLPLVPIILNLFNPTASTYITKSFKLHNLQLIDILWASRVQFKRGVIDPLLISLSLWAEYRLSVILMIGVVISALVLLADRFKTDVRPIRLEIKRYITWMMIGLGFAWMGIGPYLISKSAQSIRRTHIPAMPGEAVMVVSLLWLGGVIIKDKYYRTVIRLIGVAFLVGNGVAEVNHLQNEIDTVYSSGWEYHVYYLRSLAHIMPDIEENTLIVYIAPEDISQSPFASEGSLFYAIKYLYYDRAVGIIASKNNTNHETTINDEGGSISPRNAEEGNPIAHEGSYTWSEIVFVTKEADGQVVILDEIPEIYYTAERAALYDPYARIREGYLSERLQEMFPLILPPIE